MDALQKNYYRDMLERGRATMLIKDGHLLGIVTYFVGDDDEKFLTHHKAWTLVEDDENGETLYIDQLIIHKEKPTALFIHREFKKLLLELKKKFPNIKRVKWVRVGAQFRKHGNLEGVINGRTIHNKNITA